MIINKDNIDIQHFHNCTNIFTDTEQHYDRAGSGRVPHLEYSVDQVSLPGTAFEFGVYNGRTIGVIANKLSDQNIYGFDSFEGLPEDWQRTESGGIKHVKGHFALDALPEVPGNVTLVKGFFDTSLPKWLEENLLEQISFLHVDCDLYSSTVTVLECLQPYIVPNTIIVFDELYAWHKPKKYSLWHEGEYKALQEWVKKYNREFEILSRTNHEQTTIRVIK